MSSTGAAIILYFLPLPLLGKAFYELVLRGRFAGFAISLALFALFVFGAELMRRGIGKSMDFKARKVALAGGAPLKTMGAAVIGLEPSCLLSLRDEFLVLGLADGARHLAGRAFLLEEFLACEHRAGGVREAVHVVRVLERALRRTG